MDVNYFEIVNGRNTTVIACLGSLPDCAGDLGRKAKERKLVAELVGDISLPCGPHIAISNPQRIPLEFSVPDDAKNVKLRKHDPLSFEYKGMKYHVSI